jgi:heme/copper-type cytochrome/quinol oxidase subunit 2
LRKDQYSIKSSLFKTLNTTIKVNYVNLHADLPEVTRWLKRPAGTVSPMRLIKLPLSNKVDFSRDDSIIPLFRLRFSDKDSVVKAKPASHSTFLSMKQKKYKRRKVILPREKPVRNEVGKPTKTLKYIGKPALVDTNLLLDNDLDATRQYSDFKKKRKHSEMMSVISSRRLLRTKRTLVLPAHVNLTAITNSYDVIHSWFIPGLGLKMDCIPGRSTHHTFYIDNVGFYYGQCAEICGRFHHHMPIRICALPFEHFLI